MWLIDTNVISELARPKPDRAVTAFLAAQPLQSLHVSAVTLGEIRFGIARMDDSLKREQRSHWLENSVRPLFIGRTIEIGEEEVLHWRLLIEFGKLNLITFSQPDLFIAATASSKQLKLVTRNVRHFVPTSLPVLNPWTAERFNGA